MSTEAIKSAVLAECKRLWQQRKSSEPNSSWNPETNPKNFIEGLYPLSVTPEDDTWVIAPQYGHHVQFTAISLHEGLDCNHIVWMIAYRILGLDKPPAEIVLKWDGNRARYNEYITAETYSSIHQKGWHPRIYVGGHRVDEDTWNDSQAEAQQWCADTIKKLVTPQQ